MSSASSPAAGPPRSPGSDGLVEADLPGSPGFGPSCAWVTPMLTDMYQVRPRYSAPHCRCRAVARACPTASALPPLSPSSRLTLLPFVRAPARRSR
jgi:hypothetical protein